MGEQRTEFEKLTASREDVFRKFGIGERELLLAIDPGRDRSGGLVIEQYGDQVRIIGAMRDKGEFVEFTEWRAYRQNAIEAAERFRSTHLSPIIEQIARVRAER
jgi:hypothetical protein